MAAVKQSDVQYRPDDDGLAPRTSGVLRRLLRGWLQIWSDILAEATVLKDACDVMRSYCRYIQQGSKVHGFVLVCWMWR